MQQKKYDYIIAGAGCAGLSLLMRMMQDPFFADKQILVVDQERKNKNDRTWCFWEKSPGLFESIVYHRWPQVNFYSDDFHGKLDLQPYQYKMIRGIDFYEKVMQTAALCSNIEFRYESIRSISTTLEQATIELENERVSADYLFNSIVFDEQKAKPSEHLYQLIQHFKGWVIETEQDCFDPALATLMDFRINQENGTAFFYVMPITARTALVEYTLFSAQLLPDAAYDQALKKYISDYLLIDVYKIQHSEFGTIPMTNQLFQLQQDRIIQMGQAGGQIKGSSGYAFQFIQKRTSAIVEGLKNGKNNFGQKSFQQKKGNFYDAVLLQVLHHQKMPGRDIFSAIFSKNNPATVLRFLDNESSLIEDLQIMSSVPSTIFLPAAFQEMTH